MTTWLLLFTLWTVDAPTSLPGSWQTVLQKGTVHTGPGNIVTTGADGFIKWLIGDTCVVSLGANTEGRFQTPPGMVCPDVFLQSGIVHLAVPVHHPVTVVCGPVSRQITGSVTLACKDGELRHLQIVPAEPGLVAMVGPVGSHFGNFRLELSRFLRQSSMGKSETVVQSAASGSMCLDTRGATGDIGDTSTGITQVPITARLNIRIRWPEKVKP